MSFLADLRASIVRALGRLTRLSEATHAPHYNRPIHSSQFVGRVSEPIDGVLQANGFEEEFAGHSDERRSFRRLDGDEQLHVYVYSGEWIDSSSGAYDYVYAHREYRWDKRPIAYLLSDDFDDGAAVRDVKSILGASGVQYEAIRP